MMLRLLWNWDASWWFQPLWKILVKSNWIIFAGIGVKKKWLKPPPDGGDQHHPNKMNKNLTSKSWYSRFFQRKIANHPNAPRNFWYVSSYGKGHHHHHRDILWVLSNSDGYMHHRPGHFSIAMVLFFFTTSRFGDAMFAARVGFQLHHPPSTPPIDDCLP